RKGQWRQGPDMKLFKEVNKKLGRLDIIAEDLGFLTKKVEKMLAAAGYPGMKILEFGFGGDSKNVYLPHNYTTTNSICYTGTHDNETLLGWVKSCDKATIKQCKEYLGVKTEKEIPWAMIRLCWSSVCDTAVIQMQDLLELDSSARMNTPSTVGENWKWRLESMDILDEKLTKKLSDLTELYNRAPEAKKK
ncbi:MAG: 4-alpha-glucanotransferase, partial [Ruminococcus sp.]|nr:4-alpha-glucanotransferase [Ruminococcus sp.]